MTTFVLNGQEVTVDAPADTPLLWVLRDHRQMAGTRFGCGMSLCGACTVHVDDAPTRSCQMPLSDVAGKSVTTIEGLDGEVARAVLNAWTALDVPQCGYCQSGQIMSATALLAKNRKPTDAEINAAMAGNICRCGTYSRIRRAIHDAATELEG